jgi:isopentenyl-diphosphate delta-isomerase
MSPEILILVDRDDREVGTDEKTSVHRSGALHRAFSVFVWDETGRVILQRRARSKYHSGGLWSNTCCGHPRVGESTGEAAHRRLREEMGFDCPLTERSSFIYRASLDHDLTEHELDHVFSGSFTGVPEPDPAEVEEWRAVAPSEVLADLATQPEKYTVWLKPALEGLLRRGA